MKVVKRNPPPDADAEALAAQRMEARTGRNRGRSFIGRSGVWWAFCHVRGDGSKILAPECEKIFNEGRPWVVKEIGSSPLPSPPMRTRRRTKDWLFATHGRRALKPNWLTGAPAPISEPLEKPQGPDEELTDYRDEESWSESIALWARNHPDGA